MLLPLLHGTADGPFLTAWSFPPTITIGLIAAAAIYAVALRRARRTGRATPPQWQVLSYYAGLVTIAVSLLGPLDTWNDEVFFLHMAQHLVLVQFSAPLLLLGRPVQVILRGMPTKRSGPVLRTVLRPRGVRLALTFLTNPIVAFFLFNGTMVLWHLPRFYDAALESDVIHEIEHLSFLGFALVFWWGIIDPVPRHHKVAPPWAIASLFFTMMVGTAIGAVLTLSDSIVYSYYLNAEQPWGLTPDVDQQIGGLLMWVIGGLLYSGILLVMVARFFGLTLSDDETPPAEDWSSESRQPASPTT